MTKLFRTAAVFVALLLLPGRLAYSEESTPTGPATSPDDQESAVFSFALTDMTDALAQWSNQRLLRALVKPEAMSYRHAPFVWSVANRWVRANQWAGTVNVNAPIRKNAINIYIVRRAFLLQNNFTHLEAACPCLYLAGTQSIVCIDDALSRAFTSLDQHTEDVDSANKELAEGAKNVRRLHRTFMAEWIIAHEVGHLVLGHTFKDLRLSWNLANQKVGLDAERQADSFYVSSLQHQHNSQFSAHMGLSQLMTREYADQLKRKYGEEKLKNGEIRVFAANKSVEVPFSPHEHPPMLFRALNLYTVLLDRYPGMVDSSGYVDRIISQAHPVEAKHASLPQFCLPAKPEKESIYESLNILTQYADLYIYGGHKDWAIAMGQRMQQQLDDSSFSEPSRKLWQATIAEVTARINWKFKKQLPDWNELELLASEVDQAKRPIVLIQSEMTKSFTEVRGSAAEGVEAAKKTEEIVKQLISTKALTLEDDNDVYDILSTYLVLALIPKGKMDDAYFNYIGQIIGQIAKLENLDSLRRRIVIETVRSHTLLLASLGKENAFAVSRFTSSLVTLASGFSWWMEEIDYRLSEIGFLKENFASQHQVIANRQILLSQMLPTWGRHKEAIALARNAATEIVAIDDSGFSADDKLRLQVWKEKVQNDLAWFLIADGQYNESITVLDKVLKSREERKEHLQCSTKDALVHVYQNLADAKLAVGLVDEAVRFSRNVQACLGEQTKKDSKEWLDSQKTLGLALYGAGQFDEAKKALTDLVITFAKELDDNHLEERLLTATVNGKSTSIRDVIDVNAIIQKARNDSFREGMKPTVEKDKE